MKNINEVKDFISQDLLSPKQICQILNINRHKLLQILKMGELPYIEIDGRIFIKRKLLSNFVVR